MNLTLTCALVILQVLHVWYLVCTTFMPHANIDGLLGSSLWILLSKVIDIDDESDISIGYHVLHLLLID